MVLILELLWWLRKPVLGHPHHAAAILTAVAVPVIVTLLYEVSGMGRDYSVTTLVLTLALGIVIGMRSERLGTGADPWARAGEWALVIVGALVVGLVVFSLVIFLALFGSLLGLYAAGVGFATYLVVRVVVMAQEMASSRRDPPA